MVSAQHDRRENIGIDTYATLIMFRSQQRVLVYVSPLSFRLTAGPVNLEEQATRCQLSARQ